MVKKYPAPLSIIMRWGHLVIPTWIYGVVMTNPPANSWLVSYYVARGFRGYVYGFYITTPEANDFKIAWRNNNVVKEFAVYANARGTIYFADVIPINEGQPADPDSYITIRNVREGVGEYLAGLLVGTTSE